VILRNTPGFRSFESTNAAWPVIRPAILAPSPCNITLNASRNVPPSESNQTFSFCLQSCAPTIIRDSRIPWATITRYSRNKCNAPRSIGALLRSWFCLCVRPNPAGACLDRYGNRSRLHQRSTRRRRAGDLGTVVRGVRFFATGPPKAPARRERRAHRHRRLRTIHRVRRSHGNRRSTVRIAPGLRAQDGRETANLSCPPLPPRRSPFA